MALHTVHCPRCGELMDAGHLAFDFGELINIALNEMKNRNFGAIDEWIDLTGLNLCLYLTLDDLIHDYGFATTVTNSYQGNFNFTVGHLEQQILKIADNNNVTVEILANTLDNVAYQRLTHYMAKSSEMDTYELAEKIQELCHRIKICPKDAVIAKFDVTVRMDRDDQGGTFANRLEVKFEDGKIRNISKFVCKGAPGHPCGKELYGHAGKYKEIIIGLAGTARVGKTAYLASLLASIMREGDGIERLGHVQDVLINIAYSGEGWKTFKNDLLEPYIYGKKITKTPVLRETESNGKEAIPLFSMTFKINNGRNYIFTFIDMPGEVYDGGADGEEGADFVTSQRKIIRSADMIWLCIAPSQIEQEQIVATADQVNVNINEAFANIERTMSAINMKGQIPTAVLITRCDEATEQYGLYNPDFNPFASAQNPMRYLNSKNIRTPWISENGSLFYDNMKWFIEKSYNYLKLSPAIPATIENIFGQFTPMAVASYGFSVDNPFAERRESNLPVPSMIEGPFLWSLACLGIIPVYKEELVTKERKKFLGLKTEYYQELENVLVRQNQIDKIYYYPHQVRR